MIVVARLNKIDLDKVEIWSEGFNHFLGIMHINEFSEEIYDCLETGLSIELHVAVNREYVRHR